MSIASYMKARDAMEEETIMVPFEEHTLAVQGEDSIIVVPIEAPANEPVEIDVDRRGPSWF